MGKQDMENLMSLHNLPEDDKRHQNLLINLILLTEKIWKISKWLLGCYILGKNKTIFALIQIIFSCIVIL